MKPVALVEASTVGNFGDDTQSIKMGFDESSIEHLLMLLTDLYSDKPLAVVREYSTNARDSHVEAGITRPIEVTLPNTMSPFFKVRDFGIGMDAHTIATVYSKYGASSKRDSDAFNGMLGIGGKSALTYTSQFTVAAVKNNRKIHVVVSRIGQVAQMQIISDTATSEPNGVEISVPVKTQDIHTFASKAAYLYSFWHKGQVLVNGQEPKRIDAKMITDDIGTISREVLAEDTVVMGGVPYGVGQRLYSTRPGWGKSFSVVAFVNIGAVAITPSRESLMHDTKATDSTILDIKTRLEARIKATIVHDIDSAPSIVDAYSIFKKWANELGQSMPNGVGSYRGVLFPTVFSLNYTRWNSQSSRSGYVGGRPGYASGQVSASVDAVMNAGVIVNFDADSITPSNKKKIIQWSIAAGLATNEYVLLKGSVPFELVKWIKPENIIDWKTVKAIKLPRSTPVVRPKPTIDVLDPTTGYAAAVSIDDTKDIAYVSPTARIYSSDAIKIYQAFPNLQIVVLSANRWDKFLRENPTAMSLDSFLRGKMSEAIKGLTASDKKYKAVSAMSNDIRIFKALAGADIHDPEIRDYILFCTRPYLSATLTHYTRVMAVVYTALRLRDDNTYLYDSPRLKYPLLDTVYPGTIEYKHTILYLNAAYAAQKKEQ